MDKKKYNPAYDSAIEQKFDVKNIQDKSKNKEALCKELGLKFNKKIPLIGVTYTLSEDNNLGLLKDIINGILEQPVEIVLTSIGTVKYQSYFTKLSEEYPEKISISGSSDADRRKIYASADIIILTSDNEECIEESRRAMSYGVVPIIPHREKIEDYNPNQERGNAFVYIKNSPWSLFANVIRATESFRFPYDWKNIQMSAMGTE